VDVFLFNKFKKMCHHERIGMAHVNRLSKIGQPLAIVKGECKFALFLLPNKR